MFIIALAGPQKPGERDQSRGYARKGWPILIVHVH
jgi:hypothetical protein